MRWNHPDKKIKPEEIEAIFVDVDGTLVSFATHEPVPTGLEALWAIQEKGVKVCLATGRSRESIGELFDLPFDAFVLSSGQNTLLGNGEILRRHVIAKEDIEEILVYLQEFEDRGETAPDFLFIGIGEGYFTGAGPETLRLFRDLNFGEYPLATGVDLINGQWPQLMFMGNAEEQAQLMRRLTHSLATRWHPGFIDIMPKDGGKGDGILAVCEHFGISPAKAVAIGDGENDLAMFREVGLSIAMGNASDYTKARSDLVTESVDRNGLYLALAEVGLV